MRYGDVMIWFILGLLVYIQIGAVLVAWSFSGVTVDANRAEMLSLVFLWPLAIPYFRFVLRARRMMRAIEEWEQSSE